MIVDGDSRLGIDSLLVGLVAVDEAFVLFEIVGGSLHVMELLLSRRRRHHKMLISLLRIICFNLTVRLAQL